MNKAWRNKGNTALDTLRSSLQYQNNMISYENINGGKCCQSLSLANETNNELVDKMNSALQASKPKTTKLRIRKKCIRRHSFLYQNFIMFGPKSYLISSIETENNEFGGTMTQFHLKTGKLETLLGGMPLPFILHIMLCRHRRVSQSIKQ